MAIPKFDRKNREFFEAQISKNFQMDLCGNWMDSFENKTKRRLRPRETKEDQKDDSNPSSAVSKNLINLKTKFSQF